MRQPSDWQEDDLLELIRHKYEENIQLDYKRSEALEATEGKKSEISKDVSAFANSIGGTILYGMEESEVSHHACKLSPIEPQQVSKEWLEQVINSRIQPRIAGLLINPIELKGQYPGNFAYAVVIPESTTAHQASDKKYYKRFNFESVPMEDYEVRQTMNRSSRPAYKSTLVVARMGSGVDGKHLYRISAAVENHSEIVGRDVSAVLFAPYYLVISPDANDVAFLGIQYTRIAGVFIPGSNQQLSAIPAAHPMTRYFISFSKDIHLLDELEVVVVVKLFDQFGLALTSYFRGRSGVFVVDNENHAVKRTPSTLAINKLE